MLFQAVLHLPYFAIRPPRGHVRRTAGHGTAPAPDAPSHHARPRHMAEAALQPEAEPFQGYTRNDKSGHYSDVIHAKPDPDLTQIRAGRSPYRGQIRARSDLSPDGLAA